MRRWIAVGVAAVGVAWTPYLYSEWTASRGAARQRAKLIDDELQQPSAAATSGPPGRESQLSAAEDLAPRPKPPPPPQPVPVAPDPALQRRGEAVAAHAARPLVAPAAALSASSNTAPAEREVREHAEASARSPDAPLTTHAADSPTPRAEPEAPAANEPAPNVAANAAPTAPEPANDPQGADEPSARQPDGPPQPEAPAQPGNEAPSAPPSTGEHASNDAPEP